MKIEVRPIDRKRWHGKKGKESFTRANKIQALVSGETGEYATGLSEKDIKMLKDKGVKYDLSSNFDQDKPHPFWDSSQAVIKLENATMVFDTEKDLDYIKVKVMKASRFVANSTAEYEKGMYPDATHVIFDEGEEIEVKASKVVIKNKAVIEASKLTDERKSQIIMILTGKNVRGKSNEHIEVALSEIIDGKIKAKKGQVPPSAEEVLRYVRMDKADTAIHALVLEAILKSVLRKDKHKIVYMDSTLGNDIFDVIDYLKEDDNQELKLRLIKAVNE